MAEAPFLADQRKIEETGHNLCDDEDFEPGNTDSEEEQPDNEATAEDTTEEINDEEFVQASLGQVQMPTLEELDWALAELNMTSESIEKGIKENFEACDVDGSGTLDKEELGDLLVKVSKLLVPGGDVPTKEEMEHAVDAAMDDLDVDRNGELDIEEFSHFLKMYVVLSANVGSGARQLASSTELANKRRALAEAQEQKRKEEIERQLQEIGLTRKMVRKEIRETFALWDTDNSGTIEQDELKPLLRALVTSLMPGLAKPSDEELNRMVERELKTLDKDGDGVLERNEFADLVKRYLIRAHYAKLEKKTQKAQSRASGASSAKRNRTASVQASVKGDSGDEIDSLEGKPQLQTDKLTAWKKSLSAAPICIKRRKRE